MNLTDPTRIGMLTPSSNTVLEPLTMAMMRGLENVTAHFARFRVTEIALSQQALKQFDDTEVLRAAELLADARVDVIAWNGTSASWLGFERDERLCERIFETTGIKACTSVLAFREILHITGAKRVGIVTPYTADVQQQIIRVWGENGFECVSERHRQLQDNFSFARVDENTIAEMTREVVAEAHCDAVAIVCTNMRGAAAVGELEAALGVPVYDSVATTVWKSLSLAGIEPSAVKGWGSLFQNVQCGLTNPSPRRRELASEG
jgi:maleate isomerase